MTRDEKRILDEKYDGTANSEFEADRERLANDEPLAYIIGWQPFLGLKIYLDSRPLIPRPETEWWTERLLANVGTYDVPTLTFLDLCAGSGAIGCAVLAKIPNSRVFFGEIDEVHETTIFKNIYENSLDKSRSSVRIGDLFEPFVGLKFDVIAVNPPYIPTGRELPKSVENYEPTIALRSGFDGLDLMRRISTELHKYLNNRGEAWIECDSLSAYETVDLFEAQGLRVKIRTDQYNMPRTVVVSYR